jgi:hypothetical protein
MRFALRVIVPTLLVCSFAHAGESCIGVQQLQQLIPGSTAGKMPSVVCGSLTSVLAKIMNRNRTSGRKLEDDKPLNPSEAQANLNAALRDAGIRRRIDQMRREVPDENARLVYEAAILDEEGYYNARDLRIQQLSDRLK